VHSAASLSPGSDRSPEPPHFAAEDSALPAPELKAPESKGQLPFFYCKISAKNLPQYDVFSSSDPVCFVTEAGSRRILRA
jgi:hypothetical protein